MNKIIIITIKGKDIEWNDEQKLVVTDELAEQSSPHKEDEITSEEKEIRKLKREDSRVDALLVILRRPENMVIMITVFVCGLLRLMSFSVLFLFMKDDMGASETAIGLADASGTLAQFLVFPFTHALMRKLGGPVICMEIGIASWCVLLLATSFVTNPVIAIVMQVLQGFNGLFRAAYIQHTCDVNSKIVYNTMFSINVCLHFGVGGTISSLLGGVLYYKFQGAIVFQGSCVLGAVWLLFMLVFFHGGRRGKWEGKGKGKGKGKGNRDSVADKNVLVETETMEDNTVDETLDQ